MMYRIFWKVIIMGQAGTKWMPSADQIKIVELLINPDDRRAKVDKLKEANVPKSTFYRWMQEKEFINYIREQLDTITDSELPEVWKALILKCKRGDIQAIKLYFEMKNMYVERKEIGVTLKKLEDFF